MTQGSLITVAETAAFEARAKTRLSAEEKTQVIELLAADPKAGLVMRETGGIRKLRFATQGKGKSGSVRIVYYFYNETMPVFLLTVFAKKEKDNLTSDERRKLKNLVVAIRRTYGAD
ncbi:type II toxin-antitoxin system RelE/ParE family toxin [Pelagibius sp.]|uniref:type II toxin-antitoxin system RelE/ParE family toxin n=1 Tax=Pelagibius sp. TaxID=1931238 RepID=UPI00260A96CF|nr:type II toxin-antitoxin system RelE/ParE family toxin [Pelagibius sp.]